MKLNIGCGNDIREGYINIDIRKPAEEGLFLEHDINTPLPFSDNIVDEILSIDILEHFGFRETNRIFNDWVRVLKEGGIIEVLVPNIDIHIKYYLEGKSREDYPTPLEWLRGNIFGGQDYDGNFHKTCFNCDSLKGLFEQSGLKVIWVKQEDRAIIIKGEKVEKD